MPEPLLEELRISAAKRKQSMTTFIHNAIRKAIEHEGEYERAKKRMLARLENPPDLGTHGRITWTRDELHDRELSRYEHSDLRSR
jgi:hypothetical protein